MKVHCQPIYISNASIVTYNNSSFGELKDGGSQVEIITYLVCEKGKYSYIMRQSKRLRSC